MTSSASVALPFVSAGSIKVRIASEAMLTGSGLELIATAKLASNPTPGAAKTALAFMTPANPCESRIKVPLPLSRLSAQPARSTSTLLKPTVMVSPVLPNEKSPLKVCPSTTKSRLPVISIWPGRSSTSEISPASSTVRSPLLSILSASVTIERV